MAQAPAPEPQHPFARYAGGVAPFLAVVAQFGLIVLVVKDWQMENVLLSRVMDLAFVGFIIHHLLPLRFRLPFFAMLSLVAIVFGLGATGTGKFVAWLTGRIPLANLLHPLIPGATLIGIGLGLIGICHFPIRFGVRVAAVAVVAAGLTVLRANSQWFPDVAEMWVILGSMFMFRLMVYLYDLKPPDSAIWISYQF